MNYFSQNKWTRWLILALVVLNLISLSALWLSRSGPPDRRPPRQGGNFLQERLGLDRPQMEAVEAFREAHFAQTRQLNGEIEKKRIDFFELLGQATPDSARIQAQSQALGEAMASRERMLWFHLRDIRSICSPAQQMRFDTIIRELIPSPPPGHGPPGARPPRIGSLPPHRQPPR
jgi:protein CpxP